MKTEIKEAIKVLAVKIDKYTTFGPDLLLTSLLLWLGLMVLCYFEQLIHRVVKLYIPVDVPLQRCGYCFFNITHTLCLSGLPP